MFYKTNKISEHIIQIEDITGVSVFLVIGEERALLIDTAMGLRGLTEIINDLTDLPYKVVLTHGHGDHAGGCQAFESVYINAADIPLIYQHDQKWRGNYITGMFEYMGNSGGVDFEPDRDLLPTPDVKKRFLPLTDGMSFDLGGITVEMLSFAGHTKGMMSPLIVEERTILFGDACNPNTLVGSPESTSISEYLASLKRIKSLESRYDRVLFSHGDGNGSGSCLDDNMELCEQILAGCDAHIPITAVLGDGYLAAEWDAPFHRADGRSGNIFYTELTAK